MLRGAYEILDTVCGHLGGIKPGETTKDGKFTVIEVECQGACSNAPMLVVGDDFYVCLLRYLHMDSLGTDIGLGCVSKEDLTEETTRKVLDAFKKGEKPKPGPQSGRHTSENSAGLTALTSKVRTQPLSLWTKSLCSSVYYTVYSRTVQESSAQRNSDRHLFFVDSHGIHISYTSSSPQ